MCSSASAAKQSKMSAVNAEDRHMDYSEGLFEQTGEGAPISDTHEQHSGMRSVQNLEAVINEGLRVALLEKTPDDSLDVLLEHLGKALNGERTYIFEQNESGCDDNTYEWAADGVLPEKENLQNLPPEVCASWYRNFRIGRHIVIESLESIRETDPLQYENLKRQGIHSLVVIPLYCIIPETAQPVPRASKAELQRASCPQRGLSGHLSGELRYRRMRGLPQQRTDGYGLGR